MLRDLTFHGGRIADAEHHFPDAPRPWLDLSTGINPHPWRPPAPVDEDLHRLPSPDALRALEDAAAAAFGTVAAVAATPGSEIALRLLAYMNLPRPWHVVTPCYRTHRDALPGATCIAAHGIEEAAGQGGTLLLANPNNPDGRLLLPDRLLALARRAAARGGVLVVDEAFADALDGASILPLLRDGDPVLVLRSFGKFYGLAGVRLGFACGAPALVAPIAAVLGSWPVSATALALGTAACRDAGWAAATRARLAAERDALDALLRAHGLAPRGACPLFRLVETERAAALFAHLAGAGILTRPFEDHPHWLRLGLPGSGFARLAAALSSFRDPSRRDDAE